MIWTYQFIKFEHMAKNRSSKCSVILVCLMVLKNHYDIIIDLIDFSVLYVFKGIIWKIKQFHDILY